MNSIWLSLLWKEWCEQRWKLAALTGALVGGLLSVFAMAMWEVSRSGLADQCMAVVGITTMILFAYTFIASQFIAMGVSAGENSRRTLRFLQAQPVPMWQAGLVKLGSALVVLLIPIFCLVATEWLLLFVLDPAGHLRQSAFGQIAPLWRLYADNPLWSQIAASGLCAASLMIWASAAGVNRSDEVRAGAISFLFISGIWLACFGGAFAVDRYFGHVIRDHVDPAIGVRVLLLVAALPGGIAIIPTDAGNEMQISVQEFAAVGIGGHALVVWWFLRRFGAVAPAPKHTASNAWTFGRRSTSNVLPFRTELGAIAWKQFRETGPLALLAAGAVLVIAVVIHWFDRYADGEVGNLSQMVVSLSLMVGLFVTMVTGIGVHLEDFQPGVNAFWRSRPVNTHLWFIVKYLTGFTVLVATFGTLMLASNWGSDWRLGSVSEAFMIAYFFLLIYTLSLTAFVLVRQPIYAVILAVCSLIPASLIDAWFMHDLPPWVGWTILIAALVGCISLAWQAVVRDWGWKQHR